MSETTSDIFDAINELSEALLACHPSIPVLLQRIHKQLSADPATVTLMSSEQINTLFQALEIQTNTSLIEASTPKRKASTKITVDDL